jgi:hypothetical protein
MLRIRWYDLTEKYDAGATVADTASILMHRSRPR